MKRFVLYLILGSVILWSGCDTSGLADAPSTTDAPTTLDVASKGYDGAVRFKGNYYLSVPPPTPDGLTWAQARDLAAATDPIPGCTPHLATLTSKEENEFVSSSFPDAWTHGYWLGAYQPDGNDPGDPASGWTWVTGEPWVFTNWAQDPYPEPNDAPYDEVFLQFSGPYHRDTEPGTWNDLSDGEPGYFADGDVFVPYGYVVEWSCSSTDNNGTAGRASGNIQLHTAEGPFGTVTFSAVSRADGSVNGRFNYISHRLGYHESGDIECIAVIGNEAWFAGTSDVSSEPDRIGIVSGFHVVDNGEGMAQDQAAWPRDLPNWRWPSVDTVEKWCAQTPYERLLPYGDGSFEGNIQVK